MGKLADYFGALTLYDLFGYLLPGLPALVASGIVAWSIAAPEAALIVQTPSGYIVLGGLVIAYLLGHAMQAAGNAFLDRRAMPSVPRPVAEKVNDEVRKRLGLGEARLEEGDLSSLARVLSLRGGTTATRDILDYRHGYYRGMTLTLGLTAVSLIVRAAVGTAKIKLDGAVLSIPDGVLLVSAVILFGMAWGHYRRFQRFRGLLDRYDALTVLRLS